ncbi:hypothetical protein T10_11797 [Trichinella papuae]|uniref:Uncharacterized protein n=1 Tax=Trichinella papuae TaxID=268474 RepID=A0A0V1M2D5_9BILA|nr:hypothetical protein T10_11797 [Trichinella papuae]
MATCSGLYLMGFVRIVQIDPQQSRRVGRYKENNHNDLDDIQLYCDSGQDKHNSTVTTRRMGSADLFPPCPLQFARRRFLLAPSRSRSLVF